MDYIDFQTGTIPLLEASWRNSNSSNSDQVSYKSDWPSQTMFTRAVMFLKTATGSSTDPNSVYINGYAYERPAKPPATCESIVRKSLHWPSIYDDEGFDYDLFHSSAPDNTVTYRNVHSMLQSTGIREGLEVLDIGCGNGWALNNFAISKYVGVDPSSFLLSQLQSRYNMGGNREVVQCRFEDFVSRRQFDFALVLFGSANQIEYSAIQRIPHFLKPNGTAIIMYEAPVPDVLPPMPFDNRTIESYSDHVVEQSLIPDLSIHPFDIQIIRK